MHTYTYLSLVVPTLLLRSSREPARQQSSQRSPSSGTAAAVWLRATASSSQERCWNAKKMGVCLKLEYPVEENKHETECCIIMGEMSFVGVE